MFGKNEFSSATISVGGNPSYGQQNPMQGTIPTQGESLGIPSSQGPWNPWQVSVPLLEMPIRGKPFHSQWNPRKGSNTYTHWINKGKHFPKSLNVMQAQPFMSYNEIQSMTSQQEQNLYTGQDHGYY
jgi:hypothetical protein